MKRGCAAQLDERLSALIHNFGDVLHIKPIHIQASGVRCQVSAIVISIPDT